MGVAYGIFENDLGSARMLYLRVSLCSRFGEIVGEVEV